MAQWVDPRKPWQVAVRVTPWAGNTGGAGEPLPPGCTAMAGADAQARRFLLWAYSPGGELVVPCDYDRLVLEGGPGSFPGGRLNTMGAPVVSWHDHQLKIFGQGWGQPGGQPEYLWRILTWITLA